MADHDVASVLQDRPRPGVPALECPSIQPELVLLRSPVAIIDASTVPVPHVAKRPGAAGNRAAGRASGASVLERERPEDAQAQSG